MKSLGYLALHGRYQVPGDAYLGAPSGAPFTLGRRTLLQIAVFVDAGYLYAQASQLLCDEIRPRSAIQLSVPDVLGALGDTARNLAGGARLLRVYWYDGVLRNGRLTSEQSQIARAPNAKLRLGLVNSMGQQKGVDSLIVTDLIDLARNRALSDALILSGDEDIRVGVQVAQTLGVRVHLLGIKPAMGSQSPDLVREADTHHEWAEAEVGRWMTIHEPLPTVADGRGPSRTSDSGVIGSDEFDASATAEARRTIAGLDQARIGQYIRHLDASRNEIPSEIDRPTLARLRNRLGRDLTDQERRQYRTLFAAELRTASKTPTN